jgi:hypothetical protein
MAATASDDWRQLAEAARDEEDPRKLLQLIEELNRKLETRTRNLDLRSSEMVD